MPTWEGSFTDRVDTELTVPASGRFQWHTNPSTRPLVMGKRYRSPVRGARATPEHLRGRACRRRVRRCAVEPGRSASIVTVDLDWDLPDDLDLEVYEVENGKETQVATSGNIPSEKESVTLVDVQQAASYLFRVINYASVPEQEFRLDFAYFDAQTVDTTGLIEAWTLTCEIDGEVVEQVPVVVDRGKLAMVDLDVCGPKGPPRKPLPVKGKR